jgi:spore coat protein U-like protein
MNTRKLMAVACAIALAGAPAAIPAAQAGTATANLSVSTSVAGTCTIGAGSLTFAAYTGVVDNGSATVLVTCSSGLSPFITLNTNASGQRNLTNGASTLPYTLCEDSACATPITNTTHFAVAASTGGTSDTIFGQIPASESALTGSYSDTVTMTLNF